MRRLHKARQEERERDGVDGSAFATASVAAAVIQAAMKRLHKARREERERDGVDGSAFATASVACAATDTGGLAETADARESEPPTPQEGEDEKEDSVSSPPASAAAALLQASLKRRATRNRALEVALLVWRAWIGEEFDTALAVLQKSLRRYPARCSAVQCRGAAAVIQAAMRRLHKARQEEEERERARAAQAAVEARVAEEQRVREEKARQEQEERERARAVQAAEEARVAEEQRLVEEKARQEQGDRDWRSKSEEEAGKGAVMQVGRSEDTDKAQVSNVEEEEDEEELLQQQQLMIQEAVLMQQRRQQQEMMEAERLQRLQQQHMQNLVQQSGSLDHAAAKLRAQMLQRQKMRQQEQAVRRQHEAALCMSAFWRRRVQAGQWRQLSRAGLSLGAVVRRVALEQQVCGLQSRVRRVLRHLRQQQLKAQYRWWRVARRRVRLESSVVLLQACLPRARRYWVYYTLAAAVYRVRAAAAWRERREVVLVMQAAARRSLWAGRTVGVVRACSVRLQAAYRRSVWRALHRLRLYQRYQAARCLQAATRRFPPKRELTERRAAVERAQAALRQRQERAEYCEVWTVARLRQLTHPTGQSRHTALQARRLNPAFVHSWQTASAQLQEIPFHGPTALEYSLLDAEAEAARASDALVAAEAEVARQRQASAELCSLLSSTGASAPATPANPSAAADGGEREEDSLAYGQSGNGGSGDAVPDAGSGRWVYDGDEWWAAEVDQRSGDTYYYSLRTRETTWERPATVTPSNPATPAAAAAGGGVAAGGEPRAPHSPMLATSQERRESEEGMFALSQGERVLQDEMASLEAELRAFKARLAAPPRCEGLASNSQPEDPDPGAIQATLQHLRRRLAALIAQQDECDAEDESVSDGLSLSTSGSGDAEDAQARDSWSSGSGSDLGDVSGGGDGESSILSSPPLSARLGLLRLEVSAQ